MSTKQPGFNVQGKGSLPEVTKGPGNLEGRKENEGLRVSVSSL